MDWRTSGHGSGDARTRATRLPFSRVYITKLQAAMQKAGLAEDCLASNEAQAQAEGQLQLLTLWPC
jgi:hypothetical protein